MKKVSTTALSKSLNTPLDKLFATLIEKKHIYKKDDNWILTNKGIDCGGEVKSSDNFKDYIIWPVTFDPYEFTDSHEELLNSTKLGEYFNISSRKTNIILSELGWIENTIRGWEVTIQGKRIGGRQFENYRNGKRYVLWPKIILENKSLNTSVAHSENHNLESNENQFSENAELNDFRSKFPANFRAMDGHYVRSKAELIIDNFLYMNQIIHAYEKKLPIEENLLSEFYIPSQRGSKNLYIEYWGLENDSKYLQRKNHKLSLYKNYEFNLIELTEEHINNLDDHLPRLLLQYGLEIR